MNIDILNALYMGTLLPHQADCFESKGSNAALEHLQKEHYIIQTLAVN